MTTVPASKQSPELTFSKAVQFGIIGGLAGGVVFGIMMAMMGMLPMVGMLIGQENAVVGFIVHLVISAIIGATFALIAVRLSDSWGAVLGAGVVFGIVWWILGALILMPLLLGMAEMVLQVGGMQWMSLVGHVAYGVVLAIVFNLLRNR